MPPHFPIKSLDTLSSPNNELSRDAAEAFTAGQNLIIAPLKTNWPVSCREELARLPQPVHSMCILLCQGSLKGQKRSPLLAAHRTSHTTPLQCFLHAWHAQLEKKIKISFFMMHSSTASWGENALRYQRKCGPQVHARCKSH